MSINFAEISKGRVRNVSGHERGVAARKQFNLDSLDFADQTVEVFVPDELDAIATSFFQGMFAKSVENLGSDVRFLQHYRFNASPVIMDQIIRGLRRVNTIRGSAFFH